jgi:hypothetical protein
MNIYYTVYKTTNQINDKIYIGVHKTDNPNDSYLGSNRILKDAVKKYGQENFTKEVLCVFDNEESMWAKERELVNEDFVSREDTYNIGQGGEGWTGLGQYVVNNKVGILSDDYLKNKKPEVSRKTQIKLKEENKGVYGFTDEERTEYGKRGAIKCREMNVGIFALTDEQRSENGIKGSNTCKERGVGLFGLTFEQRSETSKKTIREMCPDKRQKMCSEGGKIGGRVGVNNKTGIHNLSKEQRSLNGKKGNDKLRELGKGFFSKETQSELGKRGGKKTSEKYSGYRWYNDGVKEYWYTPEEQDNLSYEDFLHQNPQYTQDRLKRDFKERPKSKGKRTLTNGIQNIMLLENEASVFLQNNPDYRYGRTNFVNNKKKID